MAGNTEHFEFIPLKTFVRVPNTQLCTERLCSIVLWNVEKKEAICGSPASAQSAGHCHTISYSNQNDEVFISAGKYELTFLHTVMLQITDR